MLDAPSAVNLNKTFSDRDTHTFISDRDTSYSETDIDLNVSEKDTSSFSGKSAKQLKEIIYDTDEEDSVYIQTNKRRRQAINSESISNTENQRLKNIKQNLFSIIDKEKQKSTVEFKDCRESRAATPGFESCYDTKSITYNDINMQATPRDCIMQEDVDITPIISASPSRVTENIVNKSQMSNLDLPSNSLHPNTPNRSPIRENVHNESMIQAVNDLITKGEIKIINNKLAINTSNLQTTAISFMAVDSHSPRRMEIETVKSPLEFIVPKKATKLANILKYPSSKKTDVATANRYAPLENNTEKEIREKTASSAPSTSRQNSVNKTTVTQSNTNRQTASKENKFKNPPSCFKRYCKLARETCR